MIPTNSVTLQSVAPPFAFVSSTMFLAVDFTCTFISDTCDFICSHLALSRSCTSVNAFFALLIKVSCVLLPQVWQTVPLPHITSTAEHDIMRAADYIEFTLKNPDAADNLLDAATEQIGSLADLP